MLRPLTFLLALVAPAVAADPAPDALGDPLPPGAVARLGTERFRNFNSYTDIKILPDGKTLVAMVKDKNNRFDLATGLPAGTLPVPRGERAQIPNVLSDDGKTAATVKYDGFDVWETATGRKVLEIKQATNYGNAAGSLSADGKLLAVAGKVDEKAKEKGVPAAVWDVAAKKQVAAVRVAQNSYSSVALSGDGKTLATWGYHSEPNQKYDQYDPATDPNRLVQVWDAATGKERAGLRVAGPIAAVAVSPDGTAVAASSGNGEIQVWDGATGKPRYTLVGRSRIGKTLAFSPDGATLAATADDAAAQLFDVAAGKAMGVTACPVPAESASVRALRFTGPGRAVAVAVVGSTAVAWEVPSGKRLSPAGGHTQAIFSVAFAAGGKEVLTSVAGADVLRWDRTGKELGDFALTVPGWGGPPLRPTGVGFPPGGKVASGVVGSEACVFDLPAGTQRCALPGESTYSNRLHFDAARGKVVMVVPPGYVRDKDKPKPWRAAAYDVAAGRKLDTVPLPAGAVVGSGLSPDGKTLIVARKFDAEPGKPDTALTAVDVATGEVKADIPVKLGYGPTDATFAPDGKTFLMPMWDGSKKVYATATLKVERELKDEGRGNPTAPHLFSPDGKTLAMAYGDGFSYPPAVLLFDWAAGTVARKVVGHSQQITCLAFADDGKTLASGSFDTTGAAVGLVEGVGG